MSNPDAPAPQPAPGSPTPAWDAQAWLAAIVESSDDAIVSKTTEGIITSWNRAAERLFGYTAAEAVGRSITLIIPPSRLDEDTHILRCIRRGERVEHFETIRRRKDGTEIPLSLTISPIHDASGRVVGASKIARDISERKQAEEARQFLAEAGEVLASSLDYEITLAAVARLIVPRLADWCSIYIVDASGQPHRLTVAHADPARTAWARELGQRYPPNLNDPHGVGAVLRTGRAELMPEVTEEMVTAAAHDANHLEMIRCLGLRSVMIVPLNARDRTLGAIVFVASESGRRYGPADLALAEYLGRYAAAAVDNAQLYQEVRTALAQREEAVRQLGLLIDASGSLTRSLGLADVLAAVLDLSHRLIAADAYAIWRYRAEAGCWEVARSSGLSETYLQATGRIMAGGSQMPQEPVVAEDVQESALLRERREMYRAEGIASLLVAPLRIHGEVSGTLVFYYRSRRHFDEITVRLATALANLAAAAIGNAELYEREAALRRQAQETDRRKDLFLATLAHELRNPLAPIRNALQILQLGDLVDPNLRWARDVIDRQTRQLTRLVDDLLEVSRISTGKVRLHKEVVDLAAVVERAVETSRPLIDAGRHELSVELPPEPLHLEADPARLAQVLANLLNNAAKYSDPGGKVWLTARREGNEAVVSVRDAGVGILADLLPAMFDLFTQADRSLARSQGGLGIGLTLVRSLVEMHGGKVTAHSDGPGKGSEFVVRLPALAETAPSSNGQLPAAAAGRGSGRVLVVDDNPDAAQSLALLLQIQGHQVHTAPDGPAALQAAASFRPEVVFLDIGLPGMDGYEVARRLRQQEATRQALLVALTGYGQEDDRRRAQEAGFDLHLTKPADPHAVAELLARPHSCRRQ